MILPNPYLHFIMVDKCIISLCLFWVNNKAGDGDIQTSMICYFRFPKMKKRYIKTKQVNLVNNEPAIIRIQLTGCFCLNGEFFIWIMLLNYKA